MIVARGSAASSRPDSGRTVPRVPRSGATDGVAARACRDAPDRSSAMPDGPDTRRVVRPVVGRFAPTPSGHLHLGSIFSALLTWLDARAFGGEWFVRVDDLDAPRVLPGAEAAIVAELDRVGLVPDRPIMRQQGREARYREALDALQPHLFACLCSRRELSTAPRRFADGAVYPGTCRARPRVFRDATEAPGRPSPAGPGSGAHDPAQRYASPAARSQKDEARPFAWRFALTGPTPIAWTLDDAVLGPLSADGPLLGGDFIVWRRDGRPNAILAGLVDDLDAGVTRRVRGIDLLTVSLRQTVLQRALQGRAPHQERSSAEHRRETPSRHGAAPDPLEAPTSWHHPLVYGRDGDKLAKSRNAPDTRTMSAPRVLAQAIGWLPPDLIDEALHELIDAARRATTDDRGLIRMLLDAARQATAPAIRDRTLRWPDDVRLPHGVE